MNRSFVDPLTVFLTGFPAVAQLVEHQLSMMENKSQAVFSLSLQLKLPFFASESSFFYMFPSFFPIFHGFSPNFSIHIPASGASVDPVLDARLVLGRTGPVPPLAASREAVQ